MNPSISKVALYARVSTSNGHQDPLLQLRELREYAERRGWVIVEEVHRYWRFRSEGFKTPLNRLMADAHRRRFDAVLVWKLDRFGRSLRHLVNALAEMGALGIAFVSLRDNLDLSTPAGRLMFQIIGAMAEFERALIQERVKAGLRNARAKGKHLGRPRVFVSAEIANLRNRGCSWSQIVAETGISKSTAQRALANVPKNPAEVYRSWLDAAGTPITVQQQCMRHSSITTTLDTYGAIVTDEIKQAESKVRWSCIK